MTLNEMVKDCHETAVSKGWWNRERTLGEILMLCVSEIAEATECVRNGEPGLHFGHLEAPADPKGAYNKHYGIEYVTVNEKAYLTKPVEALSKIKPEGEAIELVDCQIRIMDYFGYRGWNLEQALYDLPSELKDTINQEIRESKHVLDTHLYIVLSLALGAHYWEGDGINITKVKECLAIAFYKIDTVFKQQAWDWEYAINTKIAYNFKRPYRHGGKLA